MCHSGNWRFWLGDIEGKECDTIKGQCNGKPDVYNNCTHSMVRIWKILVISPKDFANNLTVVILGLVCLIL